jgi:bacterioferritin-associated ferredoxin
MDICPKEAVRKIPRSQPRILTVNTAEVDQDALQSLCREAGLDPEQIICPCTVSKASEAAAAILKGARTPEEVSLMTGIRTSCGMWCIVYIERLLRAYDLALAPPNGYRWYDVDVSIWKLPDEIVQKYPKFRIEDDRKVMRAAGDLRGEKE